MIPVATYMSYHCSEESVFQVASATVKPLIRSLKRARFFFPIAEVVGFQRRRFFYPIYFCHYEQAFSKIDQYELAVKRDVDPLEHLSIERRLREHDPYEGTEPLFVRCLKIKID